MLHFVQLLPVELKIHAMWIFPKRATLFIVPRTRPKIGSRCFEAIHTRWLVKSANSVQPSKQELAALDNGVTSVSDL